MNSTTITKAFTIAGIGTVAGLSIMIGATAAHATAGSATDTGRTAYARNGVIYTHNGTGEVRLTDDEVNSQPSVSPDGTMITYVHNGTVWVMDVDGTDQHQVSDRTGTRPTWSPDSTWITYTATSCTGAPGTFRVGTEGATASEPLLPVACRDQAAPRVGFLMGQPDDAATDPEHAPTP